MDSVFSSLDIFCLVVLKMLPFGLEILVFQGEIGC